MQSQVIRREKIKRPHVILIVNGVDVFSDWILKFIELSRSQMWDFTGVATKNTRKSVRGVIEEKKSFQCNSVFIGARWFPLLSSLSHSHWNALSAFIAWSYASVIIVTEKSSCLTLQKIVSAQKWNQRYTHMGHPSQSHEIHIIN